MFSCQIRKQEGRHVVKYSETNINVCTIIEAKCLSVLVLV